MGTFRKVGYKGFWIVLVYFLIAGVTSCPGGPYQTWMENAIRVSSDENSAAFFLQKYVADGICAGSGLLLIILLATLTFRKIPYWTIFGTLPVFSVLLPPIFYAVSLVWRAFLLVEPPKADLILRDDALHQRAFLAAIISGPVIHVVLFLWHWDRCRPSIGKHIDHPTIDSNSP